MLNTKLLGGTASAPAVYVDDVFSTYLYTGNGSTQTITNGIDESGKGALTWIKCRATGGSGNSLQHCLYDTNRGIKKSLDTSTTGAQATSSSYGITAFNNNGFTVEDVSDLGLGVNETNATYCSWTFREQAKFFDVVTYTGNGANRTIAHNLGSVPGMIIVKRTDNTGDWFVYHRSNTANPETDYLRLNSPLATIDLDTVWNDTAPTSTVFSVGTNTGVNASSGTYVAYLFAHNAGGFGTSGTDNVISCGGFTIGASNVTIDLGYEPQYVLIKQSSDIQNWLIFDMMRGFNLTDSIRLAPDTSGAEAAETLTPVTSTGFTVTPGLGSASFVYMAIRRPMKPPTSGTEVFSVTSGNFTTPRTITTGFPVDLSYSSRTGGSDRHFIDRLRGGTTTSYRYLATNQSSAEIVGTAAGIGMQSNTSIIDNDFVTGADAVWWSFRRASGFFDTVCYTGTAATQNITHNLGVVPELIIVKSRSGARSWAVYAQPLGNTKYLLLNTSSLERTSSGYWNDTTPTSSVFTIGSDNDVSLSGATFISYLFATLAGISKVGSYTGNGGTQAIACGFTGGARFVMIKRTDAAGEWYIWDTARGIVSGNDPYLIANTSAAQTTTNDSVDPDNSGFVVNQLSATNINVSSANYIFLAIA